ncbi:MAG TPA: FAD-dependent oxidoreductase [Candidatus Saccharimonadales bacterium]
MRIVVVGGGFAGVKAAKELAKDSTFQITLISDQDYFLHHATLYATATGRSRKESVIPLVDIFARYKNVTVVKDSIETIDVERRLLNGKVGSYNYDNAILAMGVVTTYFGISGLAEHSYGIKTLNEVDNFKRHLHDELVEDKHMDKNYVIVGAGPTGVELAGALRTYLREIATAHRIKRAAVHLSLVEAAPRVLPRMSKVASKAVTAQLRRIGIRVLVNKKVEAQTDDNVIIDGRTIPSQTVVWTSGVTNHPFFAANQFAFRIANNGRIEVDKHMRAAKNVYILGDNAATPFTGTAMTALHDARFIARYFKALVHSLPLPSYTPKEYPVTVPVGGNWAIFESSHIRITGILGAILRRLAEFKGYKSLLPFHRAFRAWRARYERAEDCPLCREQ